MARNGTLWCIGAVLCTCAWTLPASGQWVDFNEEAWRLDAPLGLGASDPDEKDYAWGDVDQDGDIDLVCVRKQPFTTTGKRVNVLFMNEGGILVDRTADYATAADVAGDQGFNTPTNDRDVVLADVNLDGWLDIITATTLTDFQAKHISHPRIYMNLGEVAGEWQGFEFQDDRIPQMHATAGPRFCSVAAGDVTGDGYPDLYFGDYDTGPTPDVFDYNNKLLINDGKGFFTDETTDRLTLTMYNAAFGAAADIRDMNGDGVNDIVKQTSLNPPQHVAVTYNNPANEGVFNLYDINYSLAPYFVSVGDLNNDGKLDMAITDDNIDGFMLNLGNDGLGQANFSNTSFPSATNGFGSQSVIADLNNDGWQDVVISDVDVDIPGCTRTADILRNLGNAPNVSFAVQGQPVPNSQLTGVHNFAVFDINNDGWLDLVIGRCSGTQVWVNQPPFGMVFDYPMGLPAFVPPQQASAVQMHIEAVGGGTIMPGSGQMFLSVNEGAFQSVPMQDLGDDVYQASFPVLECTDTVAFYFSGQLTNGSTFFDPPGAPAVTFDAIVAQGTSVALLEEFEEPNPDWTVVNQSVASGAWVRAEPVPALFNGQLSSPDADATGGAENTEAYITGINASGQASDGDVDGGPTRLLSPVLDLAGTDAMVNYSRWFFSDGGQSHVPDFMTVEISNDGGNTWVPVPEQTTGGTDSAWETAGFTVSDYVQATATVRIRFSVTDNPNNSITEGGIDDFQIDVLDCGPVADPCPTDINDDGETDVQDLVELILNWDCTDPPGPCPGDVNQSGQVDVQDLVDLILEFGACP